MYDWSINRIPDFWAAFWEFGEIKASRGYDRVVDDLGQMPGAKWFEGARLNFAENLLRYRDDRMALIFKGEASGIAQSITYAELYSQVAALAKSLREEGIQPGDRVVGFMPNMMETIIAMLAATSLGAVWSSCSPDFGIKGVLDRFGQIEPKVLFTANGYSYNGKSFDSLARVADIITQLPSIRKVVVVPYTRSSGPISDPSPRPFITRIFCLRRPDLEIDFVQVPADHPLYIMYSSGTTGLPKCMVQGVAGILVHHLKELRAPHRSETGRHDFLFHHLRLDDVELVDQFPGRGGHPGSVRRFPLLSRPGGPLETGPG